MNETGVLSEDLFNRFETASLDRFADTRRGRGIGLLVFILRVRFSQFSLLLF